MAGFFFFPQTFGELCSNVTLFICLRISDCQIASSQGFTMGSLSSSMFQQKAISHRRSHRSNQTTHLPQKLLKTSLKRKLYSGGKRLKLKFKKQKKKHFKPSKNLSLYTHTSEISRSQSFELKPKPHRVKVNVENGNKSCCM